jgi:hypothetical protein
VVSCVNIKIETLKKPTKTTKTIKTKEEFKKWQ